MTLISKDTLASLGLLWLRAAMGLGIAYHGYQKVFGGRMAGFAEGVSRVGFSAPVFFAWAVALSELLGGILIILGLKTRFAALLIVLTMSVAAFVRHAADPFRVKELALAYLVMAGTLLLMGAGKWSLDKA